MVKLEELLEPLVSRGGSDLHLSAGSPPKIRLDGNLVDESPEPLGHEDTKQIVYSILTNDQIATFEEKLELDLSFGVSGLGRFRTNVFQQRGTVAAVFRLIPFDVKSFEELGLPAEVCTKLCKLPKGLILVTGATGSGKSTTLAAMIDYINRTRESHIVTIEDPIEFLHRNKRCLFNQREVGSDTLKFKYALRSVLRQDPDVVLIGEIRDLETAENAIQAALTGHLVFSTLHTNDAPSALTRLVDMGVKPFLVASAVMAIMAQRLIRRICLECRQEAEVSETELRAVGLTQQRLEEATVYEAVGCPACNNSGYKGRQGVYELMEMSNDIREMAFQCKPTLELRAKARSEGMVTLQEDAIRKVLAGVTTIPEVLRITHRDA